MAKLTPQEYAEKWSRRTSAAGADMQRGIERTQQAPGALAAAAQPALVANWNNAIQSGRWAKRVAGVSLQDWKTATISKGVPRVAQGAQQAQSKMATVAQSLLPAVDAAAAQARAIPKVTIEDSVNRAATYMRAMRAYKERSA